MAELMMEEAHSHVKMLDASWLRVSPLDKARTRFLHRSRVQDPMQGSTQTKSSGLSFHFARYIGLMLSPKPISNNSGDQFATMSVAKASIASHHVRAHGDRVRGPDVAPADKAYRVGLKEDLLDALSGIESSGSFASFKVLPEMPPAGLFVPGIGDIAMPLSETRARELIAKARRAPFGKGSNTIVDTSVRNTWELDASQFIFRDFRWAGYLQMVAAQVASALGINAPIKTELYKMLIYEKGAMFKAHTDTEKCPGMFGTLVISLPSPHQGGDVVLRHCNKEEVFKSSASSASFACWYSDVSHEVLPVTSGYRWVLTYNLAHDLALPRPSAINIRSKTQALRDTLGKWLAETPRTQNWLFHATEHVYTQANISLSALKGRDLAQVQVLRDLSHELPFNILLALLELENTGGTDYGRPYGPPRRRRAKNTLIEMTEVYFKTYSVQTIVDLGGRVVSDSSTFDENSLLDKNCFEKLAVTSQDYEGFQGNWGPTLKHWYRTTAVVIVPRDALLPFLNIRTDWRERRTLWLQLRYMADEFARPDSKSPFSAFKEICQQALMPNSYQTWSSSQERRLPMDLKGKALSALLQCALSRADYGFFEESAALHSGCLPMDFFDWLRNWLQAVSGDFAVRFHAVEKGLTAALLAYCRLDNQLEAVRRLHPMLITSKGPNVDTFIRASLGHEATQEPGGTPANDVSPEYEANPEVEVNTANETTALPWMTSTPNVIQDWVPEVLHICLRASVLILPQSADGMAAICLALCFADPLAFICETLGPIIDTCHEAVAFNLSFLAGLRQLIVQGFLPLDEAKQFYRNKAKAFITSLKFENLSTETDLKAFAKKMSVNHENDPKAFDGRLRKAISPKALAEFFSHVLLTSTESDNLAACFVEKLVANANKLLPSDVVLLWLPFLRLVLPILASSNIPLNPPLPQQMFRALLIAFVEKCVVQTPSQTDLARPGVDCVCRHCDDLNTFLFSPTRSVGRFPLFKDERQHLHQQLDWARIDCIHETERDGTPETLVVTKTFQQVQRSHQEWQARLHQAATILGRFDQAHLRLLLGPEHIGIIDTVNSVVFGQTKVRDLTHSVDAQGISRTPPRPVAGQKRKAPAVEDEVIDLTSD